MIESQKISTRQNIGFFLHEHQNLVKGIRITNIALAAIGTLSFALLIFLAAYTLPLLITGSISLGGGTISRLALNFFLSSPPPERRKNVEEERAPVEAPSSPVEVEIAGVKADLLKLRKAADAIYQKALQGSAPAMYKMARIYELGAGRNKDPYYAEYWYLRYLESGSEEVTPKHKEHAQRSLIKLYLSDALRFARNIGKAAEIFQKMEPPQTLEELGIHLNPIEEFEFAYWIKDCQKIEDLLDQHPNLDLTPFLRTTYPTPIAHFFDPGYPNLATKVWRKSLGALFAGNGFLSRYKESFVHYFMLEAIRCNQGDLVVEMINDLPAQWFAAWGRNKSPLFRAVLYMRHDLSFWDVQEIAKKAAQLMLEKISAALQSGEIEGAIEEALQRFLWNDEKDPSKALQYLHGLHPIGEKIVEGLAERGDREAAFVMGLKKEFEAISPKTPLHEKRGCYQEALVWYRKSAEQNFPLAFLFVADIWAEGRAGITRKHLALKWYTKAADSIHDLERCYQVIVLDWLIHYYYEQKNGEKTVFYLNLAATLRFPWAEKQLKDLHDLQNRAGLEDGEIGAGSGAQSLESLKANLHLSPSKESD